MARLTLDDLLARCSPATRALNAGLFPNSGPRARPEPEPAPQHEPVEAPQAKAKNPRRYVVSVKSFRVQLTDEDNLVPKWHIDALRYAGVLHSDAPGCCRIVTTQEKVAHYKDERTEITVELVSTTPPEKP